MLSIFISTIVFFFASWFLRRYLDDQGIPRGMTRGVTILVFAALVSWATGSAISWAQEKASNGPAPSSKSILLQSKDADQP